MVHFKTKKISSAEFVALPINKYINSTNNNASVEWACIMN